MQRARTAQQARDLRLRNAAVASAAAGRRPATAGSPTGWVHPPGGRRGICTGRSYASQVRGGRRMSSNGGSSARARRSSGGGGGGRRVPARMTTGHNNSRQQGRGPGSLRPGGANYRATDDSRAESQLEAAAAAGSRSFGAAPASDASVTCMPRTPMSPLDEQAPAAHDGDPVSFWLADQVFFTSRDGVRAMSGLAAFYMQYAAAHDVRPTSFWPTDHVSAAAEGAMYVLPCHPKHGHRLQVLSAEKLLSQAWPAVSVVTDPDSVATLNMAGGLYSLWITAVQDGPGITQQGSGAAVVVRPQSASLHAMAVEQGGSPLHPQFQVHSKASSSCEVRVNAAA